MQSVTAAAIESKLFSTKYMLSTQTDVTLLDLIFIITTKDNIVSLAHFCLQCHHLKKQTAEL